MEKARCPKILSFPMSGGLLYLKHMQFAFVKISQIIPDKLHLGKHKDDSTELYMPRLFLTGLLLFLLSGCGGSGDANSTDTVIPDEELPGSSTPPP